MKFCLLGSNGSQKFIWNTDPPSEHLTDTLHVVDDPNVLLVHVTPFNSLMWDCRRTPTVVIDHGVCIPHHVSYRGDILRGIVVMNNIAARGRRLGADIYMQIHREIPLDLVGIGTKALGGLGAVPPPHLPACVSRYRFFFNPIRYTSLSLAMCEAMMIGMPIVGLATTETVTTIENGVSGYFDTDIHRLVEHMQALLTHPDEARRLGIAARRYAQQRFHIDRFVREWEATFAYITNSSLDGVSRVFHSSIPSRKHVVLPQPVVNGNGAHPATLRRHCKNTRGGVVLRP